MRGQLRTQLGEKLRAQRRHWGLTQESLAHRVGFTPRYIAGIERGEQNFTLDTLDKVSAILGLDPVALLNGHLSDTLPEPRERPDDANPVERRAQGRQGSAS